MFHVDETDEDDDTIGKYDKIKNLQLLESF